MATARRVQGVFLATSLGATVEKFPVAPMRLSPQLKLLMTIRITTGAKNRDHSIIVIHAECRCGKA